jgi:hypothetical protein
LLPFADPLAKAAQYHQRGDHRSTGYERNSKWRKLGEEKIISNEIVFYGNLQSTFFLDFEEA